MLYDELDDKDAFEEASVKLKAKEAKLNQYVKNHKDLHRRKDREQVVGFDKRVSAEAVGKAQSHYKKWAKSIGAESGPKTLAGYYDLKYNNSKESRLYARYVEAVNKGNIDPLVKYDNFKKMHSDYEKHFVGIETGDGEVVKGITPHFTDRMIGTHEWVNKPDPNDKKKKRFKKYERLSTSIEDAMDALKNPKKIGPIVTKENGLRSKLYFGERAAVSFNPDTKELVQVQPKRSN